MQWSIIVEASVNIFIEHILIESFSSVSVVKLVEEKKATSNFKLHLTKKISFAYAFIEILGVPKKYRRPKSSIKNRTKIFCLIFMISLILDKEYSRIPI